VRAVLDNLAQHDTVYPCLLEILLHDGFHSMKHDGFRRVKAKILLHDGFHSMKHDAGVASLCRFLSSEISVAVIRNT
jgi:hypothetical protein